MKYSAPAAQGGQEPNLDHRTSKFSKKIPNPPTGTNRENILEEIDDRWSTRGFYPSPCRAMIALLEGVR